jgi:hypothetical protein
VELRSLPFILQSPVHSIWTSMKCFSYGIWMSSSNDLYHRTVLNPSISAEECRPWGYRRRQIMSWTNQNKVYTCTVLEWTCGHSNDSTVASQPSI